MKYHEYDNFNNYKAMKENNLTARYELYIGEGFNDIFKNHDVHYILDKIKISKSSKVLVRGTGTGADACIFADLGCDVTGIDLIPDAISQAKINTKKLGLEVNYMVDNICNMQNKYDMYDVIYDSYCLQSIVSDADRKSAYDFVKKHLKPNGIYIILSAGYSSNKDYCNDILDKETGIVLTKWDNEIGDLEYEIVNGEKYVPTRRHYTLNQFKKELKENGFKTEQSETLETGFDGLIAICKFQ